MSQNIQKVYIIAVMDFWNKLIFDDFKIFVVSD